MPYIDPKEREQLQYLVNDLKNCIKLGNNFTPGTLNYLFTIMAHAYVDRKGLSYTTLNDVVGVFESAKVEFQRVVVNPYEDQKIKQNGPI